MISSIHWVPAGVSARVPKKYELSSTERELVELMEKHGHLEGTAGGEAGAATTAAAEADETKERRADPASAGRKAKKAASANDLLPADLRMDEYSSDEDEDVDGGMAIGRMLVGKSLSSEVPQEMVPDEDDDDEEEEGQQDQEEDGRKRAFDSDDNDDDDDDDDLADIPDTREFVRFCLLLLDKEGLAMEMRQWPTWPTSITRAILLSFFCYTDSHFFSSRRCPLTWTAWRRWVCLASGRTTTAEAWEAKAICKVMATTTATSKTSKSNPATPS